MGIFHIGMCHIQHWDVAYWHIQYWEVPYWHIQYRDVPSWHVPGLEHAMPWVFQAWSMGFFVGIINSADSVKSVHSVHKGG